MLSCKVPCPARTFPRHHRIATAAPPLTHRRISLPLSLPLPSRAALLHTKPFASYFLECESYLPAKDSAPGKSQANRRLVHSVSELVKQVTLTMHGNSPCFSQSVSPRNDSVAAPVPHMSLVREDSNLEEDAGTSSPLPPLPALLPPSSLLPPSTPSQT